MEFNEKIQQLRKQRNLTQEQLAEQLYVSRTAISKWESGKGYPSIESLKYISKFFSVTIDELLSGEELISLAQTENCSNLKKVYDFIFSLLDMMAIACIFLPLYGKSDGTYIHAVNLFDFTDTSALHLTIYCTTFIAMMGIGTAKLLLTHFDKEAWGSIVTKYSLALTAAAICFLAAAREPYTTALIFLLFVAKIFVLTKRIQTK